MAEVLSMLFINSFNAVPYYYPIDLTSMEYIDPLPNTGRGILLVNIITMLGPAAVFKDDIVHFVVVRDSAISELSSAYKRSKGDGAYGSVLKGEGVYKVYEYGQREAMGFVEEELR